MSISVCPSVFPVFFSRRLIGWYTGFWQWFWHPTYPTRCLELGWAVPHSDFLAWLSSATLKNLSQVFQVGFWRGKKKVWSTHRVDWEDDLKNEDDQKNEDDIKNGDDLKMKTTSFCKFSCPRAQYWLFHTHFGRKFSGLISQKEKYFLHLWPR